MAIDKLNIQTRFPARQYLVSKLMHKKDCEESLSERDDFYRGVDITVATERKLSSHKDSISMRRKHETNKSSADSESANKSITETIDHDD